MAEALEADAADVPDARQEFGPFRGTTDPGQDRRMCLRSAVCHMEHVESWFQRPCMEPPVPHCESERVRERERLRTWAKLWAARGTLFGGCGW